MRPKLKATYRLNSEGLKVYGMFLVCAFRCVEEGDTYSVFATPAGRRWIFPNAFMKEEG